MLNFTIKNLYAQKSKVKLYQNFSKNYFDQTKDKPKRHFMLRYQYIEDMHYKRSNIFYYFNLN